MAKVIKVFSGKSLNTMVTEGGTGHWKLSKVRAAKCDYVVVVRNRHADWSEAGVDHRTAFLIGKITGVKAVDDRFVVQFSEYADINIANAWDGSRNPVGYTTLEAENIKVASLKWRPFPGLGSVSVSPLTVEEAKAGLASSLGINPDQIEIIIRA